MPSDHDLKFGLLAVGGSWIFFGSFGVPIKSKAVVRAGVDPVVFQLHKACMAFITAWVLLIVCPFEFTYWGLVGSALWSMNGALAVISIRLAGLALAQAVWSSVTVGVSFLWGWLVFQEHIKSLLLTILSLCVLCLGMIGLSISSASVREKESVSSVDMALSDEKRSLIASSVESFRRPLGIFIAVIIGVSNGSINVPIAHAEKTVHGIQYIFSFGIGALLSSSLQLIAYIFGRKMKGMDIPKLWVGVSAASEALLAGFLWSVGNICSIYAFLLLGNVIGFPLVQCNLLVAGLWGIFYFKEVTSCSRIISFFLSSCVALTAVLGLTVYG